jgi:hypothetical protein
MPSDPTQRRPISEDMRFQKRAWAIERLGWAATGLVIAAGLGGFLGNSPFQERIAISLALLAMSVPAAADPPSPMLMPLDARCSADWAPSAGARGFLALPADDRE